MRTALLCLAAVYVFGTFYYMVEQKESIRRTGDTLYLVLAPRDPRSLFQGDYMDLSYDVTNSINHAQMDNGADVPRAGEIVITRDEQNIGHYVRIHGDEKLAPGERLLRYHHDGWFSVIGVERYFIPEGSGEAFANAKYGELKVAADGSVLLVALCDENRQPIKVTEVAEPDASAEH